MTRRLLAIALLSVFSLALLAETGFALPASALPYETSLSCHRSKNSYRSSSYRRRTRSSKTRTALRIAAPAAVGAGIGVLAGGKKGAAAGALIGGGSGAVYHLYKSRRR